MRALSKQASASVGCGSAVHRWVGWEGHFRERDRWVVAGPTRIHAKLA
jgi:hypothetical protein